MQKIFLLLCLMLFAVSSEAQFIDNFADGDFSNNPEWIGDNALYKVNTSFQLQLNASGDGTAILATPNSLENELEWSFWIKLSFSPSDNNMVRVYLSSDIADLKGNVNGYYLKFGETGSNDAIELVRQSGNTHTVICRGPDGILSSAFAIRVKATRTTNNVWNIYVDTNGNNNYQFQASGSDNAISVGNYFGLYCKYTSSNATKFYFDDFYCGQIIIDNTPPIANSLNILNENNLKVIFNEPLLATSANNTDNYTLIPGNIHPQKAIIDANNASQVNLTFTENFQNNTNYALNIANIKDLTGNIMEPASLLFSLYQAKAYDVLINEIMADPTPLVGLPDAEYIELYNRSNNPIDLSGWTITIGTTTKPLPTYVLQADNYVILCDDGSKPLLAPYGPIIDFATFGLTNAGSSITLKNHYQQVIHTVSYTDKWYKSDYKKDGGWSLELIDPTNPCGENNNWIASGDNTGGTPGKRNSVYTSNSDNIAPSIARIGVNDEHNITVWFSESCDSTFLSQTNNFNIDQGIGKPVSVIALAPEYRIAILTLNTAIQHGTLYTLTCTDAITDCAGNTFNTSSIGKFAIPSQTLENDIVINEILFDPKITCVDYVEILNISSKVLDLKDLILANYNPITNNISNYYEISPTSFLILPNEYYILATDSAAVKRCYKIENPSAFLNMNALPEMNNTSGTVALALKGGTLIDKMTYNADMHFPLLTNVDGVSLERINPLKTSTDRTNWHSASESSGFGTPGYQNSQFNKIENIESAIEISPEIFSPDNDGYNDILIINYKFENPGNLIKIQIYDAHGRKIRDISNNEFCGTQGSFIWDGINNEKQKAAIGRYIVLVEVFDLQGNVKKYKRTTVLGGKL